MRITIFNKILAISLLFVSCDTFSDKTEEQNNSTLHEVAQQETNEPVFEKEKAPKTIDLTGVLEVYSNDKAVITASPIGGYIKAIKVFPGDFVKKGQTVIVIENSEFVKLQQQYLEIQQQLDYLKNEFDRQAELFRDRISSEKVYLKAKMDYNVALSQASGLKKQLELINVNAQQLNGTNLQSSVSVVSPIDGVVIAVEASKGAFVSPTEPMVQLTDLRNIHLQLTAFERDIPFVKEGQALTFTLPEISKNSYKAIVSKIVPTLDQRRSFTIYAEIKDDTKDLQLLPGMFIKGQIELE